MKIETRPGATCLGNSHSRFVVWAPFAEKVDVHLTAPREQWLPLARDAQGYHQATIEDIAPGSLYFYRLDGGKEYPDPASRHQPEGVHGPSQVVGSHFAWEDDTWPGLPLQQYIIYELHVGTFTPEGTFETIIPLLDNLKELGVTALELHDGSPVL